MRSISIDTLQWQEIDFAVSTVFRVISGSTFTWCHQNSWKILLPPCSVDLFNEILENVFSIKTRNITYQTWQMRTTYIEVCPHLYANANEVCGTEAYLNKCQKVVCLVLTQLNVHPALRTNTDFKRITFGYSSNIRHTNEYCSLRLTYTSTSKFSHFRMPCSAFVYRCGFGFKWLPLPIHIHIRNQLRSSFQRTP